MNELFKYIIMLSVSILGCSAGNAAVNFSIENCPVFCDTASSSLLASVPRQWFGTSVTATLGGDDVVLGIDGETIGDDHTFTFANIAGDRQWTITVADSDGNHKDYSLQFTYLPIVELEGDFGYDYASGTMVLAEPGKAATEVMAAKVKWRGATTNTPEKHKRNYSIKFVDANGEKQNRKLLGLRRDNHWILDAGQPDMARVRNRVATELWLDMARPAYYCDQAPDALSGVRGEVVEMFLGNEYRGIYSLTEAMDRKQLQLVKHDTIDNVFHGGLWKTNTFNDETGFKAARMYDNTSPDYYGFETKYPELDEVFPTSYKVLYDAIYAMATSEDISSYNNCVDLFFDVPVAIDYTIFYLTINATDNTAKNIYWLCYDRAVDKRLSLAVWDLDTSVGQSWSPADWRPPITAYDYFRQPYNWLFKMFFHNRCKYRQDFLDRYDELRQSWLSTESLVGRYSTAIDRLIDCGAAAREQNRWNGDSDLYGHDLDFAAEKQYIVEWFTKRLPLLDRWMHHHSCDVNYDGYVTSADVTLVYDFLLNSGSGDYDENLDTNYDGYITSADITAIYDVLLGL